MDSLWLGALDLPQRRVTSFSRLEVYWSPTNRCQSVIVAATGMLRHGPRLPESKIICCRTTCRNSRIIRLWQVAETDGERAKRVRSFGENGDEMARLIFQKQAIALAFLFDIAVQLLDLDAFFVGGGIMQTKPEFREWFLRTIREHLPLRDEQKGVTVEIAPDGDMAGARGAARLALESWNVD